jgi:hypothetical protein
VYHSLNAQDLESLNDHVARFAERSIKPGFEYPERLISDVSFNQLVDAASEQGLLSSDCSDGMGLWACTEDPLQLHFSCQSLREIAYFNPALAYQLHQFALAYYVLRQLRILKASSVSLESLSKPALSVQGHFGLGRYSLARYLQGRADHEDYIFLQDYFGDGLDNYSTLHANKHWSQLLAPVMHSPSQDKKNIIQFALFSRAQLKVHSKEHSHGLNELDSYYWQSSDHSQALSISSLTALQSQLLYSKVLQLQWLGLANIATGALRHGYELASNYAAQRVQGGKIINQHAAVRRLLAEIKADFDTALCLIDRICATAIDGGSLAAVANVRLQIHPLICQGANNAVQVFGGMGYMQDTGVEKVLRDCMQLRLMNGTPSELTLFLSELEMKR